jgi:predicted restriction endonuclease
VINRVRTVAHLYKYKCEICGMLFKYKDQLEEHKKETHKKK